MHEVLRLLGSGLEPILLALVHLPSKLYLSETDQLQYIASFRQDIEGAERDTEITNTIVLGDFNINPFEKGMIAATGGKYKQNTSDYAGRRKTMLTNFNAFALFPA